jgi:hypothetical protein
VVVGGSRRRERAKLGDGDFAAVAELAVKSLYRKKGRGLPVSLLSWAASRLRRTK